MIFMAGGNAYSLVHEYKNGWNPEAFRERYSEVLERFDYVVGDWGYNQLRLRGFYRDGHPRANKEFAISNFVDYINEYCNFGCAHFVLAKLDMNALPPDAVIVKEEAAEAVVALNETGEQAAETAAALSGPILRWPLKERAGGPVRVPNITVSAVARAAADAERREAERRHSGQEREQRGFGSSSFSGRGNQARNGQESGSQRQGRSHGSSGSERRAQGQGSGQASNKPHFRGGNKTNHPDAASSREGTRHDGNRKESPRQGQEGFRADAPRKEAPRGEGSRNESHRNENHRSEGSRNDSHRSEGYRNEAQRSEGSRNEAARPDNRWQNRNRRRKSFGGKPGNRPEGGSRPDSGASKSND